MSTADYTKWRDLMDPETTAKYFSQCSPEEQVRKLLAKLESIALVARHANQPVIEEMARELPE